MAKSITLSVGSGGANLPHDNLTVQYLLNCVPVEDGGPIVELVVDGIIGPKTIAAIRSFQQKNTRTVDGRVDPERAGGRTIVALNDFDPHPDGPPIAIPGQSAPRGFPQGGAKGRKRARRRAGPTLPIPRHFPPVPSFPGLE
jgi:peptidoglycan hydrolase-like protein with peptidoglycan-binding domain